MARTKLHLKWPAASATAPIERVELRAQSGPQTVFLSSAADITIYGGAAGGGKSFGLLLEGIRYAPSVRGFTGAIFRRTTVQIRNPGSLWDQSLEIYGRLAGALPTGHNLEWEFDGGGKIKLAHLELERTKLDWHGSQLTYIGFDELTQFSQSQFFYMLSRNRSTCGVRPYVRATCNPDAESWVAEFVAWWLDSETGFPVPERAGVLRWFVRLGDEIIWADHAEDLTCEALGLPASNPDGTPLLVLPKSVTFIPAKVYDNPILLNRNPEYVASLMALPNVERQRLLDGNWRVRPAAGLYFQRSWVSVVPQVPANVRAVKRGWDLAATPKRQDNDPDYTCGTKVGRLEDGRYIVLDHLRMRGAPHEVERILVNTATSDGRQTEQSIAQDPGQAGKAQAVALAKALSGHIVRFTPETGDKITRFGPFSSQAQAGNVLVLAAPWNDIWFSMLEGFPEMSHDDDVDSTSRAFNAFLDASQGVADYYRREVQKRKDDRMDFYGGKKPPATLENGGVRVRCKPGVTVVYDPRGNAIQARDGIVVVYPDHAAMLVRGGFELVV